MSNPGRSQDSPRGKSPTTLKAGSAEPLSTVALTRRPGCGPVVMSIGWGPVVLRRNIPHALTLRRRLRDTSSFPTTVVGCTRDSGTRRHGK
jgi:hypothetical protein